MNDTSRIVAFSTENHRRVCDILVLENSSGFEKLAAIIEERHGGRVVKRFDGPDARRWVIETPAGIVELHHDDAWGNRLISTCGQTDAEVDNIGSDLGRYLSGK